MKLVYLLLLIGLFLLAGCKKRSAEDYKYYQPYKKNSAMFTSETTAPVADTLTVAQQSEPEKSKKPSSDVNLADPYFIVVASYVNEQNALLQKQKLMDEGYKADIFMVNNDGWYKLAIASYKTLAEAELNLQLMIENKVVAPDARIVVRRSKP